MPLILATVLAVLLIVGVVGHVTQSGPAMAKAFAISGFVCLVGGSVVFVSSTAQERSDYRSALEERYGVEVDWAPSWDGEVTATKNGVEYTCTIEGTRMNARLLCNDPIRDEFDN